VSSTRFRILLVVSATVAFAAGLVAACGDDEESTTTVTETTTSEAADDSTSTEETTTATEDTTTADGESPPVDREVTELTGFTSPTGNIGCYIDRESVRCDIAERSWEPPKAPASCKLDYGQGIELAAGGEAAFVCAGDTALQAGDPLPYGESIGAALLRCESEEAGITCRDIESGRGFSLSREGYEIF
jgi:hypothetical protein